MAFRTGAEDVAYLAREFYPVFTEADFGVFGPPPKKALTRVDSRMCRGCVGE